MLKICDDSICRPLNIIFKTCLRTGNSSSLKGDKQTIKNYRPVSLLPICGKVLENLLHN